MLIAENNGQDPLHNCVTRLSALNCTDACDYGTPCDQCKRRFATPGLGSAKAVAPIRKSCFANASAYLTGLCAANCSSSDKPMNMKKWLSLISLDTEAHEYAMTGLFAETPNATQKNLQHYCSECLRKDHNMPLERACTKKFGGSQWWPFGVACVGNGILRTCKSLCSFTDDCSNCHRYAVISRKTWLAKHDAETCVQNGIAKLCPETCSNTSLAEELSKDDGDNGVAWEEDASEESMDSGN
jgi:hypothetical protein